MYIKIIKPLFDLVFGIILFIVTLPVLISLTILLWVINDGKPFFFQKRPGKNGRIFNIIKFRTMRDLRDNNGVLLTDSDRITRVGIFIRKSSLDELPQLINILKGELSFVGPRPLLEEYLPLYNEQQRKRHNVKPGITGWAQVNGRNAISWSQKFEYDVWYVDNLSLLLDVKIMMRTVLKIIKAEGINSSDSETMKTFTGE
jgi:undecaprenyl phosphate N,N'-diacetylbacillosamine 1-phosphate transferase